MSDPNLPEGVTQKDIDATMGETIDPNLCEHENIECENCQTTMEDCYQLIATLNKDVADRLILKAEYAEARLIIQEAEMETEKLKSRIQELESALREAREALDKTREALKFQVEWFGLNPSGVQSPDVVKKAKVALAAIEKVMKS